LTLLLLAASEPRARAEADVRDQALKLLDAQPLRTDFIVLLDTSGSMAKHFEAARKFVGDLGLYARAGDTIHFIAFNERAGELMVTVRAGMPGLLHDRVANIKQPHGQFTDLGAGLEATLDALMRPGYAPLSMVFLITDFCAEPPPGSPYEGAIDGNGPCRHVTITEILKRKAAQVFATGDQQVRAVALAIDPTNDVGLEATRQLFGSVVRVDVSKGDLTAALETLKKRMLYERASLQVEQLMKRIPLALTSPRDPIPLQGAAITDLQLASSAPLPISLRPKSLVAVDGSMRFVLPSLAGPLEAPPYKPVRVLSLAKPVGDRIGQPPSLVEVSHPDPFNFAVKAENVPDKAPRWSPTEPTREVEVELVVDFDLGPKDALEKLIGREPKGEAVIKQRLRLELAPIESASPLLLVPQDGKRTVSVAPGQSRDCKLSLTSSVAWADVEALCTIDGHKQEPMVLAPGKSAAITVALKNDVLSNPWQLAREQSKEVTINGDCEVITIAGDGSKLPAGRHSMTLTYTLTWKEGYEPALVFGILLAFVLAILLYVREVRPRLEPPVLTGRLVVYDGPGDFQRVTLPLQGLDRVQLQGVAQKDGTAAHIDGDRIVLPGSETSAELYAEKYGKESVIRLRRLAGEEVMLGESKIGAAPIDLRRGRSRFSVGAYHFRIE
jgi:hypothetical protein